jgi:2-phospho-L-lactate guanylyltransferase
MLFHVLSTLRKAGPFHSITVVSGDKGVRAIAKKFRANFVWEGKRRGLNRALRLAIGKSLRKSISAVLIVHADLPLLTSAQVVNLVVKSRGYSVTLAPSKDGSGTNALLLAPPSVLPPAFGKDSFRRYLLLVNRRKLRYRVICSMGFGLDIDEPKDFRRLMHYRPPNATGRFMRRVSIRTRS